MTVQPLTERVDPKRLARLAREPARVFGFSEVRTYRWPVVRVPIWQDDWFGPGHGPWLVKGGDCPVLIRAVEKMGVMGVNGNHALRIFHQLEAEANEVSLPPPMLVTLGDKHIVAVHDLDGCLIPAVPVAYAERRWKWGRWAKLTAVPVVRYTTDEGHVALIACISPLRETYPQESERPLAYPASLSGLDGQEERMDP